ncbi:MAG: hypothetical protein ACKOPT_17510, partial [Cyanobium sp.]
DFFPDRCRPLNFTISTTNVAVDTTLYWRMSGTGITTADFVSLPSLEGTAIVDSAGSAVVATTVAADNTTEGNENLTYDLFTDSARTNRVAGMTVLINDTSKPSGVTLWGTTGSETITGTSGPDRLSGVRPTGTTGVNMGTGQIDTLTGYADADTFLLGDSRGVFKTIRNPIILAVMTTLQLQTLFLDWINYRFELALPMSTRFLAAPSPSIGIATTMAFLPIPATIKMSSSPFFKG